MVIPASYEIYRQAMKEGLFDIFLDAGAAISTPSCGPCLGGHLGIRPRGRTLHIDKQQELRRQDGIAKKRGSHAGLIVAAASAVRSHICHQKK